MWIEGDVAIKQKWCADDLEKAEPALLAAQAALDTLNKVNLLGLYVNNILYISFFNLFEINYNYHS